VSDHLIEAELKFRAADEAPLLALASATSLGPAGLGPARTVAELDRYLDTPDGRLAAVRWACRLRTREGTTIVSLKGPAEHHPGDLVHRRPESEGPAAEDELDPARWPDSSARRLLRELAGDGPLVERLSLAQERVEREVRLGSSAAGILSLDRCRVLRGGRQRGAFGIVELELSADGLGRADALGEALADVPGLQPEPESKLGLALAALRDSR